MVWSSPVPAGCRVGSNFGPRGGSFHAGDDYPPPKTGEQNVPVYSIGDGKVIGVGAGLLKGHSGDRNVLIQHAGGVLSYYGHLNSNNVSVGQSVKAGQKIGIMGYRGNVQPAGKNGTHLHMGIIVNGVFVDPSVWLSKKGVVVGKSAPVKQTQPAKKPSKGSTKYSQAVYNYQVRQNKYGNAGLLPDGINGPKTKKWKSWVTQAQRALNHFKPYVGKVVPDGDYGPTFHKQVLNVQKRNGLYQDGFLGNIMAKWMRSHGSKIENRP